MSKLESTLSAMNAALEREDFERAFTLLERAYAPASPMDRTQLALMSAHLHSLYGESGVEDGLETLRIARQNDFLVTQNPLYSALEAELRAYALENRGAAQTSALLNQATSALTGPLLARYHAACALHLLGPSFDTLGVWLSLAWRELPRHLHWRYFAWLGGAHEALGQLEDAERAYGEAVSHAPAAAQAQMLFEQAALNLSLERFERANLLLEQARELLKYQPQDTASQAQWHYLSAQAELGLGRPEAALAQISEARRLELELGEASYGVALVTGQVLMALARPPEAISALEEAVELATGPDVPYALHELGVAYLDADRPLEARDTLSRVLAGEEYPFLPETQADLAECEYRMGNLREAEELATQALAQGAIVTASLVLGAVALEYYHLDEALEHYSKALSEAAEGSREATLAHQMLADILVQKGFEEPGRILEHAQKALEHTPPADEWYYTLQGYIERAGQMLSSGRSSRTLN